MRFSYSFSFVYIGMCLYFPGIAAGVSCPAHIAGMKKTHKAVYKETCYLFVNKEVYWKVARDSCWSMGGEMLAIKDQGTMDFIRKKLNSKDLNWRREGVWLGARLQSKRWRWTDGTEMTYTNWASGEPSKVLSLFSMEDCAQMRNDDDWEWHDYLCGSLKFHYNYICQFPTIIVDTASVTTSLTEIKRIKADFEMLNRKLEFKELNTKSEDTNSNLYESLGQNFYRLMKEKGLTSKSLLNLIQESAMGGMGDGGDKEKVTSRVSSSASNQEEDNGYMKIIIIAVSATCGFLLIFIIIFTLLWRHDQIVKAKAAERAVHYVNNHSNSPRGAGTTATSLLARGQEEQRPPPIPATRPPPMDQLYLMPKEVTSMYTEVLRPNGTDSHSYQPNGYCSNHINHGTTPSSHGSDSELGACGRSYEPEERSPLMPGHAASTNNSSSDNGVHNATNPTESCTCSATSQQGEYIAMNSLTSKDSCEKLNPEEKHIYSNVHMDLREGTAVENHYESLP